MLRLWGRITSINVRKVVWTLQHLGVPFERVDAGAAFGIVQTPDYRRMNFNALVPTLEDGDVQLWESNVIVRYLCAKHAGGTLYPLDLRARFEAERWMDWQQTTLNPAGREAFVQWIRTAPERRDSTRIEASIAATEPLLDQLDRVLAERAFIAGDQLTMADIPLACEMHRWSGLPIPHAQRPHLRRWYDHLRALPASKGVLDLPLA